MTPQGLFRSIRKPVSGLILGAAALAAGQAWAAPETLVFRNAQNETLYVHIDYERAPEIGPPEGWASWKEMEKDSFFVTDSGTPSQTSHVRYTHAFYAELNGRKAAGTDYIYYSHTPGNGQAPHFTSEITFRFPRPDTIESWISGNGIHMADDPRLWGYESGVHDSTEFNMMVDIYADGKVVHLNNAFIDFLDREPGWTGDVPPTSLARGPAFANPSSGWIIRGANSSLEVPEHARGLILLDANGRTAWKAGALQPGSRVEAPAGLRQGAFRCVWLP